jgi:hypothetical protein
MQNSACPQTLETFSWKENLKVIIKMLPKIYLKDFGILKFISNGL